MIGLFPDPFGDELLYSMCGRYHDYMQYPSKNAVAIELQGYHAAKAVIDLPWNLDRLVAVLPKGHRYTIERLVNRHTLFPLYSPFFNPEEQNYRLQLMRNSGGSWFYQTFGLFKVAIPFPYSRRFCPLCAVEDEQEFGEPYWHRLHQAPGVEVCPTHQVFLAKCDVNPRRHQPVYEFVSATRAIQTIPSPTAVNLNNSSHQVLLTLATDTAWLLNQPYDSNCLESILKRYFYLISQRFGANKNRLDREMELLSLLKQHYCSDLLQQLKCPLELPNPQICWLFKLLQPESTCSPVHHLLFMQFLGFTAEAFFQIPMETTQ